MRTTGAKLTAVTLAAAALAAGALAGCGATRIVTKTAVATVTETTTGTVTVVHRVRARPRRARVTTKTVTVTSTVHSKGGSGSSGAAATGTYHGTGEKSIGTLTVKSASVIKWSCPAGCSQFTMDNDAGDSVQITLVSKGRRGQTDIDAGTYHDVQVIAVGTWSFKVVPQS